ncbi:hypothetical protein H4R18_004273 [Coemansia javaensis]|uniref:Uncharacterized protein n=1 Tax=Coemansia javaensis TaxID=2761396 RepID=A0A9W8HC54_9FUNG|nr:hypothetical protein H4R18_004273 [Coemansia javaensis]
MGASTSDDVWDLDQDDLGSERAVAAQTQAQLERVLSNAGYRSGVDAAKGDFLQEGFDEAFAPALEHGRTLGALLGALVAHRMLCRKLGVAPCVAGLDDLIARLRAFSHDAAFDLDAIRRMAPDPTTDAFRALADEAFRAVDALESQ